MDHVHYRGIPDWDALQEVKTNPRLQGLDFRKKSAPQAPSPDDAYWKTQRLQGREAKYVPRGASPTVDARTDGTDADYMNKYGLKERPGYVPGNLDYQTEWMRDNLPTIDSRARGEGNERLTADCGDKGEVPSAVVENEENMVVQRLRGPRRMKTRLLEKQVAKNSRPESQEKKVVPEGGGSETGGNRGGEKGGPKLSLLQRSVNHIRGTMYDLQHYDQLPVEGGAPAKIRYACCRDNRMWTWGGLGLLLLLFIFLIVAVALLVRGRGRGGSATSLPPLNLEGGGFGLFGGGDDLMPLEAGALPLIDIHD